MKDIITLATNPRSIVGRIIETPEGQVARVEEVALDRGQIEVMAVTAVDPEVQDEIIVLTVPVTEMVNLLTDEDCGCEDCDRLRV
jgi:hypothetical protein